MSSSPGQTSTNGSGFLYLFQFDNGVLKAGRTEDPGARSEHHRRDAGRFDIKIRNQWISEPVDRPADEERMLLAVLRRIGRRTAAGREYYRDVPFTVACYQAEHLDQTRCPECECLGLPAKMQLTATFEPSATRAEIEVGGSIAADFRFDCGGRITAWLDPAPQGRGTALRAGAVVEIEVEYEPRHERWTVCRFRELRVEVGTCISWADGA